MFKIGLKRGIRDDEIYEVTDRLRSERNTDVFAKAWESELKRKSPSMWRAMRKLYGCEVFSISILFTIADTLFT